MSEQQTNNSTSAQTTNEDTPKTPTKKEEKTEKSDVKETKDLVDLPLARVKRIMKSDKDVKLISQEAVVLVTKAAVKSLIYTKNN